MQSRARYVCNETMVIAFVCLFCKCYLLASLFCTYHFVWKKKRMLFHSSKTAGSTLHCNKFVYGSMRFVFKKKTLFFYIHAHLNAIATSTSNLLKLKNLMSSLIRNMNLFIRLILLNFILDSKHLLFDLCFHNCERKNQRMKEKRK